MMLPAASYSIKDLSDGLSKVSIYVESSVVGVCRNNTYLDVHALSWCSGDLRRDPRPEHGGRGRAKC